MADGDRDRLPDLLGLVALLIYVGHAVDLLSRDPPANLLWTCNVAAALVPAGLLLRRPFANAVGGFMLALGLPLWLIDLWQGGDVLITSPLTHVGSLVVALAGMRRLGLPRRAWWCTIVGIAALCAISRVALPPGENINLAHRIPHDWGRFFPSHLAYLGALCAALTAGALAAHVGLRRLGFVARPSP